MAASLASSGALLAAMLCGSAAAAGPIPPAAAGPGAAVTLSRDAVDRMTVPVMVNGKGPFAFLVDTGANHEVISKELAASLGLPAGAPMLVHSAADARVEPSVAIDALQVGTRRFEDIRAPALDQAAIGADGILGIDALRGQAMVMDFGARQLSMRPSQFSEDDDGSIVVSARRRYGQLILLDAYVEGIPVFVILDSGSETSVVNSIFRRRMEDGQPASAGQRPITILSVTGATSSGQVGELASLTLANMRLRHVPVVFADLYTFTLFHLDTKPAMLLGMDVMRVFDRIEIDYPSRRVSFRMSTEFDPANVAGLESQRGIAR